MGKLAGMTGIHWHVGFNNGQYKRKYRTWCEHYNLNTGLCNLINESCKTDTPCHFFSIHKRPYNTDKHLCVATPFRGVKEIYIDCIAIYDNFNQPTSADIDGILQYFLKHKKFEHPVSVVCENGEYVLKEFFKILCVAKELEMETIDAQIYCGIPHKNLKPYKKVGNDILHVNFGHGVITKVDNNIITAVFENGEEHILDVVDCFKNKKFLPYKKGVK